MRLDGDGIAPADGEVNHGRDVVVARVDGSGHGERARDGERLVLEPVSALHALEAGHGDFVDVGGEVRVERAREGERLLARVGHLEGRLELTVAQRNGLGHLEVFVPHGLGVVGREEGHLDGRVGSFRLLGQFPVDVSREAVNLDVAWAELRPAVRESAGDGLGLVEHGIGPDVEHLAAVGLGEGGDDAAEEVGGRGAAVRGGEFHRGEVAGALDLGDGGGRGDAERGPGAARGGGPGATGGDALRGGDEGGGDGGHRVFGCG